ncbi:hypothetical protein [Polaribacter porphyrae]|uniref:Uncharacterized protein n=1 Tax=Polaribacter porphyrae TaxID=1137780 RepID=A0A2S7WNM0_9FLAO|nr:hypothetical protein [Polaribacter porphyrae]PQJ78871.1 hypothetical protein BTO18_06590 [Polaribacter porphyrae]
MKHKNDIENKVEDTLNVLDTIKEVKVNHFFKHKVLQQIQHQKEEKKPLLYWLTPQIQVVAIAAVFLLNISTIFYAFSSNKDISTNEIENFAQEYALQSSTTYLLN